MKSTGLFWLVPVLGAFLVLPVQGQGITRAVPDSIGSVIAGVQVTVVRKMVPIKGKGTMWLVAVGEDSFCDGLEGWAKDQTSFLESEGTSTQMGRVTATLTNCFGPGGMFERESLLLRQELRAANGDMLYGEGRADDPELPFKYIVHFDGSWESRNIRVVGGTGRFENAVGRWDCFGDNIFALALGEAVAYTCEGEISTVGSGKRAR